ncbi:lipoyl synthase [Salisaeta longa]|uniref:lipoyl synthase n=1 Tax=Salisaeta longa TaxID=503170 RepID=UPI0003B70451|nr:lipoyl synthase [Salisaeta longa]
MPTTPSVQDQKPKTPDDLQLKRVEQEALGSTGDGDPGFFELPVVENTNQNQRGNRPDWLRVKLPHGKKYKRIRELVEEYDLHTVCESANCPNMGECWTAGTATFMILGNVCTRSCGFCAVKTGRPQDGLDWDEPRRVAEAVELMGIDHAVITSVNRDERADGGAPIFADVIERLHALGCTVEVLTPDFRGSREACQTVFDARPDVFNHNMETVPSLYRRVRPQADYQRSLDVLEWAKDEGLRTKSGIMVGLGETEEEVFALMDDFVDIGLDVMTIGQYMQPTNMHLPVEKWVTPDTFAHYKEVGEAKGIDHVESSPLTRSSYHAERHV